MVAILTRGTWILLLFVSVFSPVASAQEESTGPRAALPPPALQILAASIEEPEIDVGMIRGRPIRLWLEVAEIPSCGFDGATARYGFLIDSDRDAATGWSRSDLDFGPDARVSVACDAASRQWTSPAGSVTVSRLPEGHFRIEIATTVDRLPAIDFHWAAYAEDGAVAYMLPFPRPPVEDGPAGHARWRTYESAKP